MNTLKRRFSRCFLQMQMLAAKTTARQQSLAREKSFCRRSQGSNRKENTQAGLNEIDF